MPNKMKPNFAYDLAAKIGFFLQSKGLKTWEEWSGRMTKDDQLKAFGFYLGKGLITVNGQTEEIFVTNKVAFGTDTDVVRYLNCKEQVWWDNAVNGPLNKFMEQNFAGTC